MIWFFDHSIVSRIERKDSNYFNFDRNLAAFSVFGECAKIFQQQFFACSTGKYHCAYSAHALNELNLA